MAPIWRNWLNLWCGGVIVLGLIFLGSGLPATDWGVRLYFDAMAWPIDGKGWEEAARLTAMVLGAVMMGWGVTMLILVRVAIENPHLRLFVPLTGAILVWWLGDTSLSFVLGSPGNATANTLFLIAYLIPVIASGALKQPKAQ
ncbi:hypothetical protein PbB2_00403 [Candidatus Phycosocius bacilliformis]|uniref:Uncharacterized protein n=1 Tax=Candidatus Phycosocius bacilliformis TaxID=1445552 RepID=A0A2P2E6R2_9PROT|nr:hypothetical protein [Candidatus Phycosocius bacilliformis]GBF56746.1 hypothetical protein PbB2_00403 [Candidatus Phycosocius bacilliformis]